MIDPASISVIIPCYNEADVIASTVKEVLAAGYKVIVVDDCSTDQTPDVIKPLPIHYIRHSINLGQGAALQTGFDFAKKRRAAYFVSFDADGQHDVRDIKKMIGKMVEENLDVVLGSRFLPGSETNISAGRKLLLKSACLMNFLFTGIWLTDAHNGLRVLNRRAVESIRLRENRMAHASEFLLQLKKKGLKFGECPVRIRYTEYSRKKGQSLLNSVRIFFELLLNKIFDK